MPESDEPAGQEPSAAPLAPPVTAKTRARQDARQRRRFLRLPDDEAEHRRTARVLALPEMATARTVAAYVAVRREPATSLLLRRWHEAGVTVLLPVVLPDLDLDWAQDDQHRHSGVGPGVPEPSGPRLGVEAIARADVLVVPALAVDRQGRRLGQGGGSYDRALARRRPGALVVALLHDGELHEGAVPTEPHDLRVDVVVTPSETWRVAGPERTPEP